MTGVTCAMLRLLEPEQRLMSCNGILKPVPKRSHTEGYHIGHPGNHIQVQCGRLRLSHDYDRVFLARGPFEVHSAARAIAS